MEDTELEKQIKLSEERLQVLMQIFKNKYIDKLKELIQLN